jgi:glycerol-1-phosphatase
MAAIVDRYAGVVFDIDGVLVHGRDALPGAADTFAAVLERGLPVVVLTNNASRTPEQVAAMLQATGIAARPEQVLTSAQAAAALIPPGTRCLMVGMDGLATALRERGCVLVDEPAEAEAVVVGAKFDLVFDDLRRATLALNAGARFVGTNGDASYPTPEGRWPGTGAIIAALATASGRVAELAGKPEAAMFQAAAQRLRGDGRLLMVGDRHETDVAGAAALGWDTALVLTGITVRDEVAGLAPRPTWVLDDVRGLLDAVPGSAA